MLWENNIILVVFQVYSQPSSELHYIFLNKAGYYSKDDSF